MSEKKVIAMVIGNKQARHLSGKGAVKVLVGNTHIGSTFISSLLVAGKRPVCAAT